jgi:hypothetical protein
MKARPHRTCAEKRALKKEIQKQCAEICNQFELDYDTVQIYIQFFYKNWTLEEIIDYHKVLVKERNELKEFYEADDKDPDIHFFAMRSKLKEKGIDVEAIQELVMREVENNEQRS